MCVRIDHVAMLSEGRVTSHEMVAVPRVGAAITRSSVPLAWVGITTVMGTHTIHNDNVRMMRDVHERVCVWCGVHFIILETSNLILVLPQDAEPHWF